MEKFSTANEECPALNLFHLNDDCLLEIFAKLNFNEQYSLLCSHERFEGIVRRLWSCKYCQVIDFASETSFASTVPAFSADMSNLERLFVMLCRMTRELRSPNVLPWLLQQRLIAQASVLIFPTIRKISACHSVVFLSSPRYLHLTFPYLQCLRLCRQRRLPLHCLEQLSSNLVELHLVECTFAYSIRRGFTAMWQSICRKLLHLHTFTFASSSKSASIVAIIWQELMHSTTLRVLQLNAAPAAIMAAVVSTLPKLQQLTVFPSNSEDDCHMLPTKFLTCLWRMESAVVQRILGLRLKCYFDRHLLLRCATKLPKLRSLAWHTYFDVQYDAARGCVNWRSHDPHIARCLLEFIRTCSYSLTVLDLRWNHLATPDYLHKVRQVREQQRRFGDSHYSPSPMANWQLLTDEATTDATSKLRREENGFENFTRLPYFRLELSEEGT